jgi:hypothetical protein
MALNIYLRPDTYWLIRGGKYNDVYPKNENGRFEYMLEVPCGEYLVKVTHILVPRIEGNACFLNLCLYNVNCKPTTLLHKKVACLASVILNKDAATSVVVNNPDIIQVDLSKNDNLIFLLLDEMGKILTFSDKNINIIFRMALTKM